MSGLFGSWRFRIFLAGLSFSILSLIVLFQVMPILPTVMRDELIYKEQSLFLSPSQYSVPNYLYGGMATAAFSIGGYFAIKALNAFFLAAGAMVVFLIGLKVSSPWVSYLAGVSWVLGPASIFASFFMPEIPFFFFLFLCWFFLMSSSDNHSLGWRNALLLSASAISLVLASLTKPHALIALVGVLLFLAVIGSNTYGLLKRVQTGILFLGVFLVARLGIGIVVAGVDGTNILGRSYTDPILRILNQDLGGERANSTFYSETEVQAEVASSTNALYAGSVQVLYLLTFVALVGLFAIFLGRNIRTSRIGILAVSQAIVWIPAVSFFAALVTSQGDDHSSRALTRYLIPLIPLLFLSIAKTEHDGRRRFSRILGVILVAGLYYWTTFFLIPQVSDTPTFSALYSEFWLIALYLLPGTLIAIDLRTWSRFRGVITAGTLAVALSATGLVVINQHRIENSQEYFADRAGIFVKENFANVPGGQVAVVGATVADISVVRFWAEKPGMRELQYPEGAKVKLDPLVDAEIRFVVLLPGIELEGYEAVHRGDGFVVAESAGVSN